MANTKVYANAKTKKAHSQKRDKNQCRQGEILIRNLRVYPDLKAAVTAGYKPCRSCFPEGQ